MTTVAGHTRTDKPWGYELLIALTDRYALKEIGLNDGARTSLQSHDAKLESCYILEGEALIELEGPDGTVEKREVSPGDSFTVIAGRKHRVSARTDIRYIEVSTPELDDVRRYEDDYGRSVDG
jgi:mannose-1-phosphate guanylyltransferase|tara:strand:+ start:375 stop:743 length:369 start_codon:yes stop_codon:yes gene_type:complete